MSLGRIRVIVLLLAGVMPAPALSGVPRTTPDDPGRLWSQFPLEEEKPPQPRTQPAPPKRTEPAPAPAEVGASSGPQRLPEPSTGATEPETRPPDTASDGPSPLPLALAAGLLALAAILLTAWSRGRSRAAPAAPSAPSAPQPPPRTPIAPSLEPLEAERDKQHTSSGELHSLGVELRELAGGVTLDEPADDLREVIARVLERGAAVEERIEQPLATLPAAEREAEAETATHLLFLPAEAGYQLVERAGQPPSTGSRVEGLLVGRVGPSPLPLDERRCAYLERV